MDEIDWLKQYKKTIKNIGKIILGIDFIMIAGYILISFFNRSLDREELVIIIIGALASLLLFVLILLVLYGTYYIYCIIYNKGKIEGKNNEKYVRELPIEYPPAIISLLYDLKIDVYKDYTATILNLYLKKYIDFSDLDNKIIKGTNKLIFDLQEHERYVYTCIMDVQKFDEIKFKELIVQDAQAIGMITNKKASVIIRAISVILVTGLICSVVYLVNKFLFFLILMLIYISVMLVFPMIEEFVPIIKSTNYIRTKKGKDVARKFTAFKKFIKEYTLISEKDLKHVNILNEYIPYAISLDEADKIEKYIKINENYRKLIYKYR